MTPATEVRHALPFPGMRPFERDESELFFGQEAQISALVQRLGRARLIAVLGESGCGKSSVVKAGLIARLMGTRRDPKTALWRIAISRPGRSPLANLAEQLASAGLVDLTPGEIEALLRSNSWGLMEIVERAQLPRAHRVLIVIDQFEELFRFTKEKTASNQDEAALFVKLLLAVTEAAANSATPVYVVLTMRSEYLGDAALFFGLAEAINEGAYLLAKMTRAQMEEAITGPLSLFEASMANDLLQRLLNETEAAQQDGLPLLQHALRRIWDSAAKRGAPVRLEMRDFLIEGEAAQPGANDLLLERHLNRNLDSIYENLGARKPVAERLFKQLGEHDQKGRLIRRSCDLKTIAAVCRVSEDEVLAVVDEFRDEKRGRTFLMPPQNRTQALRDGTDDLDISHEALLRRWSRLCGWIEEETKDADEFRNLAGRANRRGDLLSGAALRRAREWQTKFSPSAAWAKRYEGPYEAALRRPRYDWAAGMAYLAKSQRHARLRWTLYVLIVLIALFAIWKNERNKDDNRERQAELDKQTLLGAQRERALGAATRQTEALRKAKKDVESKNDQLTKTQDKLQKSLDESNRQKKELQEVSAQLIDSIQKKDDAVREAEARKKAAEDAAENFRRSVVALNDEKRKTAEAEAKLEAIRKQREIEQRVQAAISGPRTDIREILKDVKTLNAAQGAVPPGAVPALARSFALSRVRARDTSKNAPVVLAMNSAGGKFPVAALREGQDNVLKWRGEPWEIQHAAANPTDSVIAAGGAGGHIVVGDVEGGNLLDPATVIRTRHIFAVTGVGLSTDGKWVATGSSSSDMKVMSREDLLTNAPVKQTVLLIGNVVKLVGFLASYHFKGDYPLRDFAISMPPDAVKKGREVKREDLTIIGRTEAGRLVRWERPGPFGKQISAARKYAVGQPGMSFSAIATDPDTQTVWAGSTNGWLGRVSGQNLVECLDMAISSGISALSWNRDGSRLAIGSPEGSVQIYEKVRAEPPHRCGLDLLIEIPAHSASVSSIVWQGDLLATGSLDGSASLLDLHFNPQETALLHGIRDLGEIRDSRLHGPLSRPLEEDILTKLDNLFPKAAPTPPK